MPEPLTPAQQAIVLKYRDLAERIKRVQIREHPNYDAAEISSAVDLGLVFGAAGYDAADMPSGPEAYIRMRIDGTLKDVVYRKDFLGDTRRSKGAERPKVGALAEDGGPKAPEIGIVVPPAGSGPNTAPHRRIGLCAAAARLGIRANRLLRLLRRNPYSGVWYSPPEPGQYGAKSGQWTITELGLTHIRAAMEAAARTPPKTAGGRRRPIEPAANGVQSMAAMAEDSYTELDTMTAGQLAAKLHLTPKTVNEMGADGRLPAPIRIGNRNVWLVAKVVAWSRQKIRESEQRAKAKGEANAASPQAPAGQAAPRPAKAKT